MSTAQSCSGVMGVEKEVGMRGSRTMSCGRKGGLWDWELDPEVYLG